MSVSMNVGSELETMAMPAVLSNASAPASCSANGQKCPTCSIGGRRRLGRGLKWESGVTRVTALGWHKKDEFVRARTAKARATPCGRRGWETQSE